MADSAYVALEIEEPVVPAETLRGVTSELLDTAVSTPIFVMRLLLLFDLRLVRLVVDLVLCPLPPLFRYSVHPISLPIGFPIRLVTVTVGFPVSLVVRLPLLLVLTRHGFNSPFFLVRLLRATYTDGRGVSMWL